MAKIKGVKAEKGKQAPETEQHAHAAAPDAGGAIEAGAAVIAAGTANYGAAKVVTLNGDDKAILDMPFAPFKVEIVDIDVVLVFQDGSKIVVPGMALAAFSGRAPLLVFTDKEISADEAVATVGEIKEQVAPIKFALSSASSDEAIDSKADGEKAEQGGGVQPDQSAATQAQNAAQEANQHKSDQEAKALTEKISNTQNSSSASPGVISAAAVEPNADDAIGPAGIGKLVPKLVFTLYNKEGVTTGTENGSTTVKGSTGGPNSSTDAAYTAQSAKEHISGTAGSDVIYADNPMQAPAGASLRTLHVEAMVPARDLNLLQITIPSLPDGYSIANATKTDKGWVIGDGRDRQISRQPVAFHLRGGADLSGARRRYSCGIERISGRVLPAHTAWPVERPPESVQRG